MSRPEASEYRERGLKECSNDIFTLKEKIDRTEWSSHPRHLSRPEASGYREGLGANRFQVFDVEKFTTHTAKLHSPHNPKVPLQGDLGGLLEKFAMHTIETSKSISEGVTWSDTLATLKIPC